MALRRSATPPGSNFATGILALYFVVVAALCVGWVLNIIKVIGALNDPISAMFIARIVGAFVAPVGGILGWF